MGPPQWKHFSILFGVDNFCFIAHIKMIAKRLLSFDSALNHGKLHSLGEKNTNYIFFLPF